MGRLRGFLWLMTGLVVAIFAGFVGFVVLSRAEARALGTQVDAPTASVVVAAHDISIRTPLTRDALTTKEVAIDAVPEGAVERVEDAVGQLTLVDLYSGEFVLSQRLLDPNVPATSGRTALVVAEDEVLMAFPAEDLMSRANVLKAGDKVDLLFSLSFPEREDAETDDTDTDEEQSSEEDKQVTFNLLQNMTISAVVADGTGDDGSGDDANTGAPEALLLTVNPQDALVLKYVKDAGGTVDIVLRAPGSDRAFTTEPVDIDYVINRYQIPAR